ncbi:LysM domain-containing protein [Desulfonispora thiosulfatigenes DSM 11270]|uniref:LysM domain-containing protein n=1 Tax=Desulfonispora thiosulfatigenes DSM 11270 TaxID=656914 RepID=A0A1W1V0E0_DESTI|nr:L,D-transpeptidase family protein [Desulfonispora thiosulfatigenes]SMB86740.1 LysM domain-containing protein [Desulfonispora thiosulfatigenes DSM 11270]
MLRLSRNIHLEINLQSRLLFFFQGETLINTYKIATGKKSTPTPIGNFKIINKKIINHPSVFGTRWLGLDIPGYGIHGTNNPNSIGRSVSNGCIRMYNQNVEELFSAIHIGTMVKIYYENPSELLNIPSPKSSTIDGKSYLTKQGDTLYTISQKLNIPLHHLVKANLSLNPKNLKKGQKINLP